MFLLLKRWFASIFFSKSWLRCAKSLLPFDVRRLKTWRLRVLLKKKMTENWTNSPPMKVISNTILFFYSLRGALIKIARGCHTWWRNYFDGTTPYIIVSLPRRYLVGLRYPDYNKLNSNWHTAWPVPNACAKLYHPEVSLRELAVSCHDPGASLLGIIKIWNISKSTATNQSAWYSRLTNEPRTLAPGIVSMSRACLFYLKAHNCKGSVLFSHLRSCFDSWVCASHILRSHKLIWVSVLSWSTRYC